MATANPKREVVIVFSGLVALGPPLPDAVKVGPVTADGPLFGVMPLSGRRLIKYLDVQGQPHERYSRVHLPVIFTKLKYTGREPDDSYLGFGIWYPVRERMQVKLDGKDTPGKLTYVHDPDYGKPHHQGDPNGPLPDPNPIEDFAAIPPMQTISPTRSKLRAGVLDEKAADVSAQLFVPSGKLRAGAEDKRKYGRLVTYYPTIGGAVPGTPHVAVVVPQVRITVEVQNELSIHTSSLDTGSALDPLVFPISNDGEIWIANLDVEDVRAIIEKLANPKKEYLPDRRECDVDFARFYDLTEGQGNVRIPCDDPPQAGERKCYTTTVIKPKAQNGKND